MQVIGDFIIYLCISVHFQLISTFTVYFVDADFNHSLNIAKVQEFKIYKKIPLIKSLAVN